MKKFLLLVSALAVCGSAAFADDFATPGDGTDYTFASLAALEGSGVSIDGETVTIDGNITITAPDSFSIDADVKTVKMATDAAVTFAGPVSFVASEGNRLLVTRLNEEATPKGFWFENATAVSDISRIDFEYAQVRNFSEFGLFISDCTFRYANGNLTSMGALSLGASGASFVVKNCTFEYNQVPAIGCAANYYCGLLIEDCTFVDNNCQNNNQPQLNLTVALDQDLIIKNCTLTGAQRNMVGGIGVGNLMVAEGKNHVEITGCTITDHRYGLTGTGPMDMVIRDNTLINNRYEDNPMNGGSAINLMDPYGLTTAIISGNHIENSLWGITVIGCKDVNIGQVDNPDSPGNNVFKDNGFDGTPYDLYNNSKITVYAQNNTWSVPEQTEAEIETVIFHKNDNPDLGEVIFMPAKDPSAVKSVMADGKLVVEGGILTAPSMANANVMVSDAAGKMILSKTIGNEGIDLSALPAGIYVINVKADNGSASLKFILR